MELGMLKKPATLDKYTMSETEGFRTEISERELGLACICPCSPCAKSIARLDTPDVSSSGSRDPDRKCTTASLVHTRRPLDKWLKYMTV